jgi:hypothetical protein
MSTLHIYLHTEMNDLANNLSAMDFEEGIVTTESSELMEDSAPMMVQHSDTSNSSSTTASGSSFEEGDVDEPMPLGPDDGGEVALSKSGKRRLRRQRQMQHHSGVGQQGQSRRHHRKCHRLPVYLDYLESMNPVADYVPHWVRREQGVHLRALFALTSTGSGALDGNEPRAA